MAINPDPDAWFLEEIKEIPQEFVPASNRFDTVSNDGLAKLLVVSEDFLNLTHKEVRAEMRRRIMHHKSGWNGYPPNQNETAPHLLIIGGIQVPALWNAIDKLWYLGKLPFMKPEDAMKFGYSYGCAYIRPTIRVTSTIPRPNI